MVSRINQYKQCVIQLTTIYKEHVTQQRLYYMCVYCVDNVTHLFDTYKTIHRDTVKMHEPRSQ